MQAATPQPQSEESTQIQFQKACEQNEVNFETVFKRHKTNESKRLEKIIDGGKEFNKQFLTELQEIDDKIWTAINKLEDRYKSQDNHMTHPFEDYKSCIDRLLRGQLENLFITDIQSKQTELKAIEKKDQERQEKLKETLARHHQELENIFNSEQIQVCKQSFKAIADEELPNQNLLIERYELKKLPLIVKDYKSQNTGPCFQWPKENELQDIMTDDSVRIQSIEIWPAHGPQTDFLHSIRIQLSNGKESPLFCARGKKKNNQILRIRRDIKQIQLKTFATSGSINGLKFIDADKKIISSSNFRITKDGPVYKWQKQEISPDETVIGIYGKMWFDQSQSLVGAIVSLGFMVVKRN